MADVTAEKIAAALDVLTSGARDPEARSANIAYLTSEGYSPDDAQVAAARFANAAKLADSRTRREQEQATDRETAARIASGVGLWRSADGVPFASIEINGHTENVPIRSRRFKAWLTLEFRAAKGKAPSTDALSIAQTEAEARAELDGDAFEVFTRVGHADGRVYVDLCDEAWRAVEIDSEGWRVVDASPIKFQRPADSLPLPEPVRGGSLDELRSFVNAADDDSWAMIKAWLIGTTAPDGPYPVLNLNGEQGSGKSTTSRRLREVIDPARTITRETPKGTHDLAIAAKRSRVLVYDNLSWLTSDMSDALCRLATGGGLGTRRLYTDDEESTFYAKRPIIVNGIEEVATRGDLLSRSIVVNLPTLDAVRDERTLNDEWQAAHPRILGGLLDATSAALARWDSVDLGASAPRMADFARWVLASDAVPGFLGLYADNREEAVTAEVDSSPFATAVIAFAETAVEWEGTASALLKALEQQADATAQLAKTWPKTAKACGDRVRRHANALRLRGVDVTFRRTGQGRLIALRASNPSDEGGLTL